MAETMLGEMMPKEQKGTMLGQPTDMDEYIDFLKEKEGKKLTAYKPVETEKYFTIGYGHYGSDVKEGMTITDQEAENLLREDIGKKLSQIQKAIPKFNELPLEARKNLLGSWFRGSLSGSPETIKLINQGRYKDASVEFLDNEEYRTTKLRGVKTRMEATANALSSLEEA
tara:strand:- start:85 stop:594 length:510 start_codon:yes stop_codon:yes gene_type:complete